MAAMKHEMEAGLSILDHRALDDGSRVMPSCSFSAYIHVYIIYEHVGDEAISRQYRPAGASLPHLSKTLLVAGTTNH